jgi:DNA-binding CsgD family transcriptional regulator
MDVGIGVLYFFTSHMVIQTMYYIGMGRTAFEISSFFLVVIAAVILAHLLARAFLRFRLFVESVLGLPAVSVCAGLGVTLALISMLPRIDFVLFYAAGALLGLACGWIVVIWTSTIQVSHPDRNSFYLHPSLLVAVVVYLLFRCIGSFSHAVTQGFLFALPLIALVCIIRGYQKNPGEGAAVIGESAQALQVLVAVAAVFALGGSIAVFASGHADDALSVGFNHMVLLEIVALALLLFCCWALNRFAERGSSVPLRVTAVFTSLGMFPLLFFVGILMGGAGIPADSPNALWESNVWVLIIAIFAYDIRESLYVIKGLAVGLMFEAMCIGQMIAYVSSLNLLPHSLVIALCLGALYFASICWQLFRGRPSQAQAREKGSAGEPSQRATAARVAPLKQTEILPKPDYSVLAGIEGGDASSALLAYCQELAQDHGLTPREAEILGLIAMGRSAKYIAEELVISLNTTRTHVKHVYEKLNIHAKQELIDLVLYGSGCMR